MPRNQRGPSNGGARERYDRGLYSRRNKRDGIRYWFARYSLPDGRRRKEKAGTQKQDARDLLVRRKAEILSYIERLRAASNLPIVYVTHSVDEISRLAAHVALMSRGRIEAVGTLEQVMRETDLRALAGHFEAGAILEGRVLSHDDAYALTAVALADQQLHMPSVDLPVGAPLRVRIRARDVALATRPPENTSIRNVLRGRITTIEPETGAHSEIALDIGAGLLRARITRHSVDHLGLKPGQEVYALVKTVAMDRRLVRARHPPE